MASSLAGHEKWSRPPADVAWLVGLHSFIAAWLVLGVVLPHEVLGGPWLAVGWRDPLVMRWLAALIALPMFGCCFPIVVVFGVLVLGRVVECRRRMSTRRARFMFIIAVISFAPQVYVIYHYKEIFMWFTV